MQKKLVFPLCLCGKKAHHQSQSSTFEDRHSCEFWTKLERDFLVQVTRETGTEKVPHKVSKSQCQSCTGQLFLYEVFPQGKSLFFHSVGKLSLLYTQAFKNTTKFFRKAFSYFWNKKWEADVKLRLMPFPDQVHCSLRCKRQGKKITLKPNPCNAITIPLK